MATGRRRQIQVQWSNPKVKVITWEDHLDLQHRFPLAPAWGQADTQEGGDVSAPTTTSTDMGVQLRRDRLSLTGSTLGRTGASEERHGIITSTKDNHLPPQKASSGSRLIRWRRVT
jgi:hypothetical protein